MESEDLPKDTILKVETADYEFEKIYEYEKIIRDTEDGQSSSFNKSTGKRRLEADADACENGHTHLNKIQNRKSPRLADAGASQTISPMSFKQKQGISCEVCHMREVKRGVHAQNKLIKCGNCNKQYHVWCIGCCYFDAEKLVKNFKCENCRLCATCGLNEKIDLKTKEVMTDPHISCSKCANWYHQSCQVNASGSNDSIKKTHWQCNDCFYGDTENEMNREPDVKVEVKHEENLLNEQEFEEMECRSLE